MLKLYINLTMTYDNTITYSDHYPGHLTVENLLIEIKVTTFKIEYLVNDVKESTWLELEEVLDEKIKIFEQYIRKVLDDIKNSNETLEVKTKRYGILMNSNIISLKQILDGIR